MITASLVYFFSLISTPTQAEPWLSNRYAQNCAACHAPGRLNKPAKERRCTLSCQGCHVNPQGGGMRNQYGIWTQQRWLRSTKTELFKDKSTPAPLSHQPYYARMKELASKATEFYGGRRPQAEQTTKTRRKVVTRKDKRGKIFKTVVEEKVPVQEPILDSSALVKEGMDIRGIKEVAPPEKLYDQHSYSEWKAIVESETDFMSVIPEGDPYRLEREMSVYASGDVRYFAMQTDEEIFGADKKQVMWLMGVDLGARLKPLQYNQFSTVIEARFLNGPTDTDPEEGFDTAQVRSAYLMADDLAYNSFVQMGLFRPMFGNQDPNHTTVANEITGLSQYATYKGFAAGTAPNVPFVIVNYLQPFKSTATDSNHAESQTSDGFVVSGGGRFVSYGLSLGASFWQTNFKKFADAREYKRNMYALTAGGTLGNFIGNVEVIRAEVSDNTGGKNAGNVNTVQLKYRMWRENYLLAQYGMANTTRTLAEGEATDTILGIKSFPISNVELEAAYIMTHDKIGTAAATDNTLIQLQAHIFF